MPLGPVEVRLNRIYRRGRFATVRSANRVVSRLVSKGWNRQGIIEEIDGSWVFTVWRYDDGSFKQLDEETANKLRELNQKKRGRLLKDCSPTDLLVACDYIEENITVQSDGVRSYLKYAHPDQIRALAERLDSVDAGVWAYNHNRIRQVKLFDHQTIRAVLEFLVGSNWSKYLKQHDRVSHARS